MTLTLICALAENCAIGRNNQLLYHLRADLQRFKAITSHHTIIMGRRTFESLPKGALPNRRNIVVSRTQTVPWENTEVYDSLEAALEACRAEEEVFVIGGAMLYAQALSLAQRLLLTRVHHTPEDADAFFPDFESSGEWKCISQETFLADEQNEQNYTFVEYQRT